MTDCRETIDADDDLWLCLVCLEQFEWNGLPEQVVALLDDCGVEVSDIGSCERSVGGRHELKCSWVFVGAVEFDLECLAVDIKVLAQVMYLDLVLHLVALGADDALQARGFRVPVDLVSQRHKAVLVGALYLVLATERCLRLLDLLWEEGKYLCRRVNLGDGDSDVGLSPDESVKSDGIPDLGCSDNSWLLSSELVVVGLADIDAYIEVVFEIVFDRIFERVS